MIKKSLYLLLFLNIKVIAQEKAQIFKSGIIFHNPYDLNNEAIITKEVVTYGLVKYIKSDIGTDGTPMYFINLEENYPNNPITILVYKKGYKDDFEKIKSLLGKTIFVSGKVEIKVEDKRKDVPFKPSITVTEAKQIKVVEAF